MAVRVGINGFGRIGRLVVRALIARPDLELVHINDPNSDAITSAHLLEFDTVHGRTDADVSTDGSIISITGQSSSATVSHSEFDSPADAPWADLGVDLVLEASGRFRTTELLQPYLDAGVRKVLKLMLPALFGVSVSQINLLLDTVIASFLPDGSVSWLYFSDRMVEFPLGVFGIAIATVILPSLSRKHAGSQGEAFALTLDWAVRCVCLIGAVDTAKGCQLLVVETLHPQ